MRFSKMHGLGNDFIIVDAITQKVCFTVDNIKMLSNRNCGIGFDQLLVVEPPYDPVIDFHCRIYNADGSEVYQCGNGIRCVARFVYIKQLTNKHIVKISTGSNRMELSSINNELISVDMGEPIFDPKSIPFYMSQYQKTYPLFLPMQRTVLCSVVSVGNPHCIILVNTVESVEVIKLGSLLETHHSFPKRVNISFMQIIDGNNVKLRVYERGVGETQACGSAACAAVAVGLKQGLLNNNNKSVKVNLPGGSLLISWKGQGNPLYMSGATSYIYDGFINL